MQYWLMKSEPDVWSIDQQKKGRNRLDGLDHKKKRCALGWC